MKYKILAALCAVWSATAFAQSVESIPFRVNMSPLNEVPALTALNASGSSTVWVHVVKNAAGQVLSGTVDFTVRYQFPGETTFTGFHIHRGAAGTNGPVVIDTRITGANPVVEPSGRGEIVRSAQIPPGSPGVAVLNDLLANPEGFYVNLHTTVNPGGAIRAQLNRTEYRVFGALLSPDNEVPRVQNSQARGLGFVTLLAGVDAQGALLSAEVTFEVSYNGFAEGTQFTGMHIHQGRGGANGPVTIDTGLSRAQNMFAGANGVGALRYVADVNVGSPASVNTVYTMLQDPDGAYLNLHTVANPGGEIRAQLRPTEAVRFSSLSMSPANEVPALTNLEARGDAAFRVSLLRRPDGSALAGLMVFDVNHSFPAETTFTGLHIHAAAAGVNGSVVLDSGIRAGSTVASPTGFGNIYRTVIAATETQINAINGLLENPRNYYLNLHTSVNPGGAVRAQLVDAALVAPQIENVIESVSDVTRTTLARGALMTIYGRNIATVPGSLDGWAGPRAPIGLNGVSVSIDGRNAPVLEVRSGTIIAQVPFETALGAVDLSVRTAGGNSNTLKANVAAVAPAIFFDQVNPEGNRVVAYDLRSGEQITQDNPARPGALLSIYGTGFGQSMPPQQTGEVAEERMLARYPDVNVLIGGREAQNTITILIPGYVGLAQTFFMAPPRVDGAQSLEVEYRGAKSNRTVLYLR